MKLLGFLALSLTFWTPVLRSQSEAPVVLKAARAFDGRSDRVVSPGLLVIAAGKIQRVGAGSEIPPDARIIDFGDATLLPGFMDAHTHLTFEPSMDARQDRIDRLSKTVAEQTLDAAEYARRTLMAGFTTVRNLGAVTSSMSASATPSPAV